MRRAEPEHWPSMDSARDVRVDCQLVDFFLASGVPDAQIVRLCDRDATARRIEVPVRSHATTLCRTPRFSRVSMFSIFRSSLSAAWRTPRPTRLFSCIWPATATGTLVATCMPLCHTMHTATLASTIVSIWSRLQEFCGASNLIFTVGRAFLPPIVVSRADWPPLPNKCKSTAQYAAHQSF